MASAGRCVPLNLCHGCGEHGACLFERSDGAVSVVGGGTSDPFERDDAGETESCGAVADPVLPDDGCDGNAMAPGGVGDDSGGFTGKGLPVESPFARDGEVGGGHGIVEAERVGDPVPAADQFGAEEQESPTEPTGGGCVGEPRGWWRLCIRPPSQPLPKV